ncbi:MAG: right-handed parallel beta-helix repeat-containing protein, partial [bacterium]|nr:right-handed parallel beta-helix repeat-containing protein [bacterium]
LAAATSSHDIWVAQGIYYPGDGTDRQATFALLNAVSILGGFPTGGGDQSFEARDLRNYPTILSGDLDQNDGGGTPVDSNAYHVVTASGTGSTAVLDGFTITRGLADGSNSEGNGGGLYCHEGSPTLRYCSFIANKTSNWGAGIYSRFSSPAIDTCLFEANSTIRGGGAIYSSRGNPIVTNCLFSGNEAQAGGAIYNDSSSSPVTTNCTFSGNSATAAGFGGAIYNVSSSPVMTNCIIWNNQ